MNELEELLSGWLSGLVAILLPVCYAFGSGMISAVNPRGFAMLPAYLSLYPGAREDSFAKRFPVVRMLRALLVDSTVTLGFILFFGSAGVVISAGATCSLRRFGRLAVPGPYGAHRLRRPVLPGHHGGTPTPRLQAALLNRTAKRINEAR